MDPIYPVIYIDAVHFSVKDSGIVKKRAAYIVLGTNKDGVKEVLGMYIGDAESSKYWLSILNELKNRGLKDIIILCADGLSGIKESINAAFPNTEYQRCIVHQVESIELVLPFHNTIKTSILSLLYDNIDVHSNYIIY